MKVSPRIYLTLFGFVMSCIPCSYASAVEIKLKASATLRAEVGLDDKTRALIAGLPTEIRLQVLKLLEDALPLIDQSIQSYLDRVNEILEVQVMHLSCAASGAGKSIVDDLSHVLGGAPTPIKDLKDQSAKLVTAFKKTSKPDEYRVAYADFLRNGNVTACSLPGAEEALVIINQMREEAIGRTRLWNRLFATSCQSAEDCFTKLRENTEVLIKKSNTQDLIAVDANQRFSRIDAPHKQGYFEKFRQGPYESRMGKFYDIQDEILLAGKIRTALASKYLEIGNVQVTEIQRVIAAGRASLDPNSRAPNISAINQVGNIKIASDAAYAMLGEAVSRDDSLQEKMDVLKKILDDAKLQAEQIISAANANIARVARIEAAEAVREQPHHPGGRWHERH